MVKRRLAGRGLWIDKYELALAFAQLADAAKLAPIIGAFLAGLALARTTQPHVILLDMRMPVMDGWAFAQEYQRDEGRRAALIVFTAATNVTGITFFVEAPGSFDLRSNKAGIAVCGEIQNAIFKPSLPLTVELS